MNSSAYVFIPSQNAKQEIPMGILNLYCVFAIVKSRMYREQSEH